MRIWVIQFMNPEGTWEDSLDSLDRNGASIKVGMKWLYRYRQMYDLVEFRLVNLETGDVIS